MQSAIQSRKFRQRELQVRYYGYGNETRRTMDIILLPDRNPIYEMCIVVQFNVEAIVASIEYNLIQK